MTTFCSKLIDYELRHGHEALSDTDAFIRIVQRNNPILNKDENLDSDRYLLCGDNL